MIKIIKKKLLITILFLFNFIGVIVWIKICLSYFAHQSIIRINEDEYAIQKQKANVVLFDLTQPLEPSNIYNKIICRTSEVSIVQVLICIHQYDFIGDLVWKDGLWVIF